MSERIWLARLSEGWCPRPEHGRLHGDSGCWCTKDQCHWRIEDGKPVAELVSMFTNDWFLPNVKRVLVASSAEQLFAEIEEHGRRQHAAMMHWQPMSTLGAVSPW